MTTFTVWGGAAPPAGASSVSSFTRTDGYQFTVSSGCQFTGYWYYVPAGETSLTGSTYTGNLWTTTTGLTGTLVSAAAGVGTGTFTAAAWNFIPITPVTLSVGVTYIIGISHPNQLEFLHNYWTTGGGGASGLTSGPITVPSATTALNNAQQPTNTGAVNTFPPAASSATWYGVDFQVDTGGGTNATVTGVVATEVYAAPAGSVTGTQTATVAGLVAAVTYAAVAGSVTGGQSASVTGVAASIAYAAPAGTVSGVGSANVAGVVAAATLSAPPGTVFGQQSRAILGAVATVAYAAPTGFAGVFTQPGLDALKLSGLITGTNMQDQTGDGFGGVVT